MTGGTWLSVSRYLLVVNGLGTRMISVPLPISVLTRYVPPLTGGTKSK